MKISEAHGLLISIVNDWRGFLANYRGIRKDSYITWTGYKPRFLDHPILSSTVAELVDSGQYTFQIVEDGSIVQIYYSYDASGNHVQAARLAFYRAYPEYPIIDTYYAPGDDDTQIEVKSVNEQDAFDEENSLVSPDGDSIDKELFSGPVESDWPVSWLRIEYAPHDAKGVLHHDCHMHLSAFPHSRFVVAGVPNPKQFIELVMALGYPESYRNHRLDGKGQYVDETKIQAVNAVCIPWEESQIFNQIPHLRIPFNTRRRLR